MNIAFRAVALLAGALALTPAQAQQYPSRPINLILGNSIGSQPDVTARVIVNALGTQNRISQPIVVENRTGANATIGANYAAQAKPDGYTLFFGSASTHPIFVKNNAVDLGKQFEPVSNVGRGQYFLYVRGSLPVHSMRELVAYSKANPGKLNSGGSAPILDVMMKLLQMRTGLDYSFIPYKVATQTITALLNGELDITLGSAGPLFLPHLKTGAMRVLLCLSEKRSALLPEAPSASETGVLNFEASYNVGFWVPVGTPKDIVAALNTAVNAVVRTPEIANQFRTALGYEPLGSTPAEQLQAYDTEIRFWSEAARLARYEPQ
jgi:tripartite-type tricarboxylate transporter receptor subunit TctC